MKNTVELIGYYGNDEIHACSAWTSTSREITDEKRNRIPALLKMLADAGHHTPFEKSSLHFLIDTDIASHIHLIKHRVGVSVVHCIYIGYCAADNHVCVDAMLRHIYDVS